MQGSEFLRRMQIKDPSIWDDLMPILRKITLGACNSMRIPAAVKEDIIQDVAIRVFTKWPSYRIESSLSTWIYSIAKHRCLDEFRKTTTVSICNHTAASSVDCTDTTQPELGVDPRFELMLCVNQLLGELETEVPTRSSSRRMVDILRYWVEHSPTMEELAKFLQTTIPAAKQRIYEIRKHIKSLCRKYCGHDDCSYL